MSIRFPSGSARAAVFVAGDDWREFHEPAIAEARARYERKREAGLGPGDQDRRLIDALAYLSNLNIPAELLHELKAGINETAIRLRADLR